MQYFGDRRKWPVLHDLSFFLMTAKAAWTPPLVFSEFVLNAWERVGRSGLLAPSLRRVCPGGVRTAWHLLPLIRPRRFLIFPAKMVSVASCVQGGQGVGRGGSRALLSLTEPQERVLLG